MKVNARIQALGSGFSASLQLITKMARKKWFMLILELPMHYRYLYLDKHFKDQTKLNAFKS